MAHCRLRLRLLLALHEQPHPFEDERGLVGGDFNPPALQEAHERQTGRPSSPSSASEDRRSVASAKPGRRLLIGVGRPQRP